MWLQKHLAPQIRGELASWQGLPTPVLKHPGWDLCPLVLSFADQVIKSLS